MTWMLYQLKKFMIQTMQKAENRFPSTLIGLLYTSQVFSELLIKVKRKQVYHSSYGSNTPSGSGVETDASKKRKKGKEELKETDINHPSATFSDHCSRTVNNTSDSWKDVSDEVFKHICFAIGLDY